MVATYETAGASQPRLHVQQLPTFRLNILRSGYLLVVVGLIIVKWPLLLQAASLPPADGVVLCLLTAMSLLALLGLRYPVGMLPILIFESLWKVLWLGIVALPHLIANDLGAATGRTLFSVLFVVPILAIIPWDYAWKRFARARGEKWVRPNSGRGKDQ
jgi:hypothetical protein